MPSGSVSFTDENISNQDLRAFTAPEVLQSHSLSSLSDVEKVNIVFISVVVVSYFGRSKAGQDNGPPLLSPWKNPLDLK